MLAKIFNFIWNLMYLIYRPFQSIIMSLTGLSKAYANIVVCVVLIFLWIFISMVLRDATFIPPVPLDPIKVNIEKSTAEQVSPNLYLPAKLDTDNNAQVVAEISGRVIKTLVRNGDKVRKNQALIQLEGGNTRSQMESARAQLRKATLSLRAEKQLNKSGLSSKANLSLLYAEYNSALASYRGAKRNYDNTTVRSPLSGVVEDRLVNVGSFASAGMPVITFLGSKRHKVVMSVALSVAQKIKVGGKLDIHLNNSDSIIPAKIVSVGRVTDANTATIKIEAIPDGSEKTSEWITGRPVTVNIHLKKVSAHKILQSVLQLDPKGRLGLYVVENKRIRFKNVNIVDERDGIEYVTGLDKKIEYIGYGFSKLHDGMDVDVLLNKKVIKKTTNAKGKNKKVSTKKTGLYWMIVRLIRKPYLAHHNKLEIEAKEKALTNNKPSELSNKKALNLDNKKALDLANKKALDKNKKHKHKHKNKNKKSSTASKKLATVNK